MYCSLEYKKREKYIYTANRTMHDASYEKNVYAEKLKQNNIKRAKLKYTNDV